MKGFKSSGQVIWSINPVCFLWSLLNIITNLSFKLLINLGEL